MTVDPKVFVTGQKPQPATPESEFDPRNPNRRKLLVVTPENAEALANPP